MIEALALALAQPDAQQPLYALPTLSYGEARDVEQLGQGPHASEVDEPVAQRFRRIARDFASAPALRFRGQTLRYDELDRRSEQLARYLLEAGAKTVAVCLKPSFDVLISLLACLKAGARYVPLDPAYPPALIASIVADVRPELAIVQQAACALPDGLPRLLIDRDFQECVVDADVPFALPTIELERDAYVLYTSGTTGRAKGVLASQRNLAHYLKVARERFGFSASDVFCSLARYTFSISFFELLSPLLVGGELILLERDDVLDPARLVDTLRHVSVLHAGPSLLSSLFHHLSRVPHDLSNLRHVSSGGDMVAPDVCAEMKRVFPAAQAFVIYGCTEIACMGTAYRIDDQIGRHYVGAPFPDTTVRVLDKQGRALPFGSVGEIYFASKGLARCYLNQPELSSQRFVSIDGQRFYRSGDLGRLHEDGNLELLGRSDFQVQLRGMRVELSGIEATIRELGLARQCAVVASGDAYDKRLVAFVVEPNGDVRAALADQLPDYMVPHAVIALDALPLTFNGKLDRKSLMERALCAPRASTARPSTRLEIAVAEAFAHTLELSDVGADDDFFALGGHSLRAILLMEALYERLGVQVSPALLFSHTTVRTLAAALEGEPCSERARPILLNHSPEAPPLFLLMGVQLYRSLARELEGQLAVYGVYADSELTLLDDPDATPSVETFATLYIEAIRSKQARGPYRVGGMSFGGIVAYEVARQLRAAGEQVEQLVMFDAVLPRFSLRNLVRSLLGRGDFFAYQHDAQLGALERRRQRAYQRAAASYRVQPYDGRATLFVAGKRLERDPRADARCGFSEHVAALRTHTIDSEHLALLEGHGVGELLLRDMRASRRSHAPQPKLQLVRTGA
jgi:amino acid adenylation domain-containing protein